MNVGIEERAASVASGRSMQAANGSRRVVDNPSTVEMSGGLAPLWVRGGARGLGDERRQEVLS